MATTEILSKLSFFSLRKRTGNFYYHKKCSLCQTLCVCEYTYVCIYICMNIIHIYLYVYTYILLDLSLGNIFDIKHLFCILLSLFSALVKESFAVSSVKSCFIVLCFICTLQTSSFYKWKICGNSASSKSISDIFSTAFARFHVISVTFWYQLQVILAVTARKDNALGKVVAVKIK